MGVTLGVAVLVFFSGVGLESLIRELLFLIVRSGLRRLFVGVNVFPPFIFVSRCGCTRILGMMIGGIIGMLAIFPIWVFI